MKGLINQPPQEQATPVPVEEEQVSASQVGGEQTTPEEQEAFEQVTAAAIEIIHNPESKPQIVQMLSQGADNPAQILGQTAMMIFSQIDEQSGGTIPLTVVLQGATQILDTLMELADAEQLFPVDEVLGQKATNEMLIAAGEMYDFDPAEMQELIESMDPNEVQSIVQKQEQIYGGQQ